MKSINQASVFCISMIGALWGAPGLCGDQSLGAIATLTSIPAISGAQPGAFFFTTTGTRSSPPSCATDSGRWVIDGSTVGGQQTIALVMSMQAQGRQIAVYGTGTCTVWGDTESVQHIDVSTS